mmetsp:Transcript_42300/g.92706  ORF Transcript_42300/g.92706 Transcript_42300/m.92706 type:complete len:269 (+) Transcript_42300:144-950(+)|eukprot:6178166-Pleurochrysis_carterae.AAC.3
MMIGCAKIVLFMALINAQSSVAVKPSAQGRSSGVKGVKMQVKPPQTKSSSLIADPVKAVDTKSIQSDVSSGISSFSYASFAKTYPNANNVLIATLKTAAADLLAQTVIGGASLGEVDWQRSFLFCVFGALYLGIFQYWYQVNVFKKVFTNVESFTTQPWKDKLTDGPGLTSLAAQIAVDLTVLSFIYLPAFYVFKASVFSGSADPTVWASSGLGNYQANFAKDALDVVRVWGPADLIIFSVPLYLRLPVRHVVSFVWTAYLSFVRGGH